MIADQCALSLLQCTPITNCKSYAADCACAECNQGFSGASCACAVSGTGCGEKNADGCTCKTCSLGYKADGKGGCTQVSRADLFRAKGEGMTG